MESDGVCTNLFTEEFLKTFNGVRVVNQTKIPIYSPEAESIFPAMFWYLIDGSQNAVWRLELEGKISQNYEKPLKILALYLLNIYFISTGNKSLPITNHNTFATMFPLLQGFIMQSSLGMGGVANCGKVSQSWNKIGGGGGGEKGEAKIWSIQTSRISFTIKFHKIIVCWVWDRS